MNGNINTSFRLAQQQKKVQNGMTKNFYEDSKKNTENPQQVPNGPIYKMTQRRFNYFKRRKSYRKTKRTIPNETKEEHTHLNGIVNTKENGTIVENEKLLESMNNTPCEWSLCEHESLEMSNFDERTNKKNSSWRNFLFNKLHNATHTINRKFFAMFRICTIYPEYLIKGELKKTLELKNRELKQLTINETLKKTDELNLSKEKTRKEMKKKPFRKKSRNLCCRQFENDLNALNYQNIEPDHFEAYNNNNDTNEHSTDRYSNYPGMNSIYHESYGTDNNFGNISSCTSVQSVNHHKERMINYNGMILNDPHRQINDMHNNYERKWEDTFYSPEDLFPSDMHYEPNPNQHPFMYNNSEHMNPFNNFQPNLYNGMMMNQTNFPKEGNFEKWDPNDPTKCKQNNMYEENENENEEEKNKYSEKPKQYQNIKHFYVASVSKATNQRRLRKISLMELYCDPHFFILEHFLTDLESYLALNHCLMYVQKNQDQLAQIYDTFYSTLIDVDEVKFLEREVTTSILRHILKRLNQLFQIPISEVQSLEFCLYLKNEPRKKTKKKKKERKIERNQNKEEEEAGENGKNEKPEVERQEDSQGLIEKKDEQKIEEDTEENKMEKVSDDNKEENEECENEEMQDEKEKEDVEGMNIEKEENAEVEEETNVENEEEEEIYEEKEEDEENKGGEKEEEEIHEEEKIEEDTKSEVNEEIMKHLKNKQKEIEKEEYEIENNERDDNEDIEDKENDNESNEKEYKKGTEEIEEENDGKIEKEMEEEKEEEKEEERKDKETEEEEEKDKEEREKEGEKETDKAQRELEKNKRPEEDDDDDDDDDCINFVEHNIYKYSILIFLNTQNDSCIEFPNTGIKISPVLGNCLIYECNNANIINAFRFNIQDDKVCFIKLNLKDDLKLHELFHQTMETKEEPFVGAFPQIPNMPNVPITNRMMGTNRINEIVRNNALNKINKNSKSLRTNQMDAMIQMNRFNQMNTNVSEESNFPNTQSAKLSFDFFNQNINMFNANLSHTLGNDNLYLRRYIDNLNNNLQKLNLNAMQSMLVEQKRRNSCNQGMPTNPYMPMNQHETYESYELEEKQESGVPFYIPIEQMGHPLNNAYNMNTVNNGAIMNITPNISIRENGEYIHNIQTNQNVCSDEIPDYHMKKWNIK